MGRGLGRSALPRQNGRWHRDGNMGLDRWSRWRCVCPCFGCFDHSAYSQWVTLTNALAGLFCASLNFVDSTRTVSPALSFRPSGHHPVGVVDSLHLFHGALPREPVCTENLTPFLKLLPCKGRAGISSLLDGHKLFDSQWQAMALDVRPVCE